MLLDAIVNGIVLLITFFYFSLLVREMQFILIYFPTLFNLAELI